MAARTQTLGMTRSLYDTTAFSEQQKGKNWYPHPDSSIREPRDEFPTKEDAEEGKTPHVKMPHHIKACEYRRNARKDPAYRQAEYERNHARYLRTKEEKKQHEELGEPQTLGMMRQGSPVTPKQDKQKQTLRTIDDIPIRTTLQNKEEHWKQEVEAGDQLRRKKQRSSRSMGHRGKHARTTAQYLRHRDEQISQKWEQPYEKEIDEDGLRIYNTQEDICIQGAREHGDTETGSKIYIRAYHTNDALNPLHKEPMFDTRDDVRTMPTHPQHNEIAWVSCKNHWCEQHKLDKMDNDCFPITITGTPNDRPYLTHEIEGYSVYLWYDYLGVAELRFNMALYRKTHKVNELTQGIKENMKIIEDAEKEFDEITQGRYEHLRKAPSVDDTSSENTEELQGRWEADGLHLDSIPSMQEIQDEEPNNDLEDMARFFKRPHESRGKPTEEQKKAWRKWCRYEAELMKERQELGEFRHIEGCSDPEQCHECYLANNETLHERQMTEAEKYEHRYKTPEEQYEELFQQQMYDDEFANDCTDGEGCGDSDCERNHRNASGKVIRRL
jgi:hypothetical protein